MTASRGPASATSASQDETLLGAMMDHGPPIAVNCANRQLAVYAATVTRMAVALVFASALAALPARPALADDHEGRDRGHERGYQHGRWDEHHRYRIYAPPAVYYPREASPGITLFIPFEIR